MSYLNEFINDNFELILDVPIAKVDLTRLKNVRNVSDCSFRFRVSHSQTASIDQPAPLRATTAALSRSTSRVSFSGEGEIGSPRKVLAIKVETISKAVRCSAHYYLRFGVLALDAPHELSPVNLSAITAFRL